MTDFSKQLEAMAARAGFETVEAWAVSEQRRLAEDAARRAKADAARAEANRPENLLEAGGFTREASPADFSKVCRGVAEARHRHCGLLFTGPTGRGKTTAARALLPRAVLIPSRLAGRYVLQAEAEGATEGRAWVLDDLGAEPKSNQFGVMRDYAGDFLFDFCERAARTPEAERGMNIITTNLTADALAARYGARVADRVLSMFVVVRFDGARSLRQTMPVF